MPKFSSKSPPAADSLHFNRSIMPNELYKATKRKNRLPMIRLQNDIDELFGKRKSLVRSNNQTSTLSSIYHIRPLPENGEPIIFLLHAPKKFIKEAPDRNKVKRWMREAIRNNAEFEKIKKI